MAVSAVQGSQSSTGASAASDVHELIAQHTDSHGRVDTQGLANLVQQAAAQDPDKASAAYQDIEHSLAERSPTDASHFAQDTAAGFLKGAAVGAMHAGGTLAKQGAATVAEGARTIGEAAQTLKDNPILSIRWTSATSAWTGRGGFTGPLKDLLDRHGISYDPRPMATPAGSVANAAQARAAAGNPSLTAKEARAWASNHNGTLFENQRAAQHTAAGAKVSQRVPVQDGSRVVDVRADYEGPDPLHNQRVEEEDKAGRTGSNKRTRAEAEKDGQRLRENAETRGRAETQLKDGEGMVRDGEAVAKLGKAAEVGGKVLLPVAIAADAYQLYGAFKEDGDHIGAHTVRAGAEVAGGWGGAVAGAEAGAALGSLAGPAGTLIGGVAGGVIGGMAGSKAGDLAVDAGEKVADAGKKALDAGKSALHTVASWF